MSAPRMILASLLSFCRKLSKLVENLQSSDKNNFAQLFFETRCSQSLDTLCICHFVVMFTERLCKKDGLGR